MSEWREVVLGDVCDRITVGHVGKMVNEYTKEGVPFLRSQNVKPFAIDCSNILYISNEFNAKLAKSTLNSGDVVIVRTGYPGTAAVIPEYLHGSNCADLVVITPSQKLNPHMLVAILNSASGKSAVSSRLVGSAQKHFNIASARSLRIRLPGRGEQDRIADVICALVDLIENNRRRIELLEQIAQAIYREWFIHFRYPGHEDVPLVESQIGPAPEGWDCVKASSALEINPRLRWGKDPKHDFVTMGDLNSNNSTCFPSESRFKGSGSKFENGDTLFARITPCLQNGKIGFVQFLEEGGIAGGSTEFIVLRGRSVGPIFTYCLARSTEFRGHAIGSMSGASGRQRVRNECFDNYVLANPPQSILSLFEETAYPLLSLSYLLAAQSRRLSAIRDLLLPKLVTGQIDVSTLNLDGILEADE